MKKVKEKNQLIVEPEMYDRLKDHLYNKRSVLGEGSPFSELLQSLVNQMLSGEMVLLLILFKSTQNSP